MSPLPRVQGPRETVTLSDGQTLTVRSLTFDEYSSLGEIDDGLETMLQAIAYATDATLDEARAWRSATPFADVQSVAEAVRRVSRMDAAEGEASGVPSSSASGTPSDSSSLSGSA